MLMDGRFWAGVLVGLLALYLWGRYQAKKAQ